MSINEQLMALQPAFSPAFKIMVNRYLAYQLGIDNNAKDALPKAMTRYLRAFTEENLGPEEVSANAMAILNDPMYASKPPAPRELALKLVAARPASGDASLEQALTNFFSRMKIRYKGLWHDHEARNVVLQQWLDFSSRYELSCRDVARVEEILCQDSAFAQYPPSEKHIEQAMGIVGLGERVTFPSKSYMAAVGRGEACALVKIARSAFGAYDLKMRRDLRVKKEFEEFYGEIVDQFLRGEIILPEESDSDLPSADPVNAEPVLAKEELLKIFK